MNGENLHYLDKANGGENDKKDPLPNWENEGLYGGDVTVSAPYMPFDFSAMQWDNQKAQMGWEDEKKANSGGAWDINGDGRFQKNEADNWWLNGGGKAVNVNNANIDWTGVKIPKGAAKGSIFAISTTDAFLTLPYETAATYGGTSFKVISTMHVQVLDQSYHYNMRPNNSMENRIRNFLTEQGKPDGTGTDFMIHYYNPIILIK